MNTLRSFLHLSVSAAMLLLLSTCTSPETKIIENPGELWPEVETTMKPWTRWWWHGNAVDKENLSRRMEEFAAAGIGGVEITPIFGVKGFEERFIDHLSPLWMEMLIHTLDEADRLGMQVDMVQGTGWPFGGPQIEAEHAAGKLHVRTWSVKAGEEFSGHIVPEDTEASALAELQYLIAFDVEGRRTDLLEHLEGEQLTWTPESEQDIYALFNSRTGQMVKRAAPGGEGYVMDHFSASALENYNQAYEEALPPVKGRLRALFNDSYEVYHADYTPEFMREFRERRGYELTDHLPLLFRDTNSVDYTRILADYRETLSDLVLEGMSENWTTWAAEFGFLTKYQAHGCPGNLLDIYATASIPECETFYASVFDIPGLRREESDANTAYPDQILLKFASSAAHVSGKPLTSSESFTWLREHFKTALSQCKPQLEQLYLSGVNHAFFHGSTYFPDEAPWPGWKFYASVNFVPTSTIWTDAPYMFEYITRCQSVLQSGRSDNEILVYWPFHDAIVQAPGELLLQLGIDNKDEWLVGTDFHSLVSGLMERGYQVDFISDDYLSQSRVEKGKIGTPGCSYSALVIPDCEHMPVATMEHLVRLGKEGAKVIFHGLPETVPGFKDYETRSKRLSEIIDNAGSSVRVAGDVYSSLKNAGIVGEGLTTAGLDFVRRSMEDGHFYYLVNHSSNPVDELVSLATTFQSAVIMDPLNGKVGKARVQKAKNGTRVYLQLSPGDALILRTFDHEVETAAWSYITDSGDPVILTGKWKLEFHSGGPELPPPAELDELVSWTTLGPEAEAFSGTASYTLEFENPDPDVKQWKLSLGDVRESARIVLNGKELGCQWSVPFETGPLDLKTGTNELEIRVTNLSANRLRDMELQGKEWKIFYEINLVNLHYEAFDATTWNPMPSGLLGPLKLMPLAPRK